MIIEIIIVLTALGLSLFGQHLPQLELLAISFVSIVLEALPFVLLGSMVGGFIEVFVPQDRLSRILPNNPVKSAVLAGLLGLVFPVCECAVIPVVRRLICKGVPLSACLTYILAGPIVNPIVAASTWVAYQGSWYVPAARLACGYTIAVITGLLMGKLFHKNRALSSPLLNHTQEATGETHVHHRTIGGNIYSALEHALHDVMDIGRFLVLGAFVAALVQTLVPQRELIRLAETPVAALLVMMVLAVVLNLCSEADAFVAASFRGIIPLSAQMGFMVLGPMLDVKLVFMYMGVFRKRIMLIIFSVVITLVFITILFFHILTIKMDWL